MGLASGLKNDVDALTWLTSAATLVASLQGHVRDSIARGERLRTDIEAYCHQNAGVLLSLGQVLEFRAEAASLIANCEDSLEFAARTGASVVEDFIGLRDAYGDFLSYGLRGIGSGDERDLLLASLVLLTAKLELPPPSLEFGIAGYRYGMSLAFAGEVTSPVPYTSITKVLEHRQRLLSFGVPEDVAEDAIRVAYESKLLSEQLTPSELTRTQAQWNETLLRVVPEVAYRVIYAPPVNLQTCFNFGLQVARIMRE